MPVTKLEEIIVVHPKKKMEEKKKMSYEKEAMPLEITVVHPKPSKGLISKAIDYAEKLLVTLLYGPPRPLTYLSGNFCPVPSETPPITNVPVKGHLPECLNGEFVRIGPNPKFAPTAGYHWFDGDGMVHGLRIKDGKATYVSRFVKTSKLKQEEVFGGSKFVKFGDLKGLFGLVILYFQILREKLNVLDVSYGTGTGNTSLAFHRGMLLALQEVDKPYVLKVLEDGDLQTLGMIDYNKKLEHAFTAHPKVDPVTGEMFTFCAAQQTQPYVTYRVISKEGLMHEPVVVTIPEPIMMHDFAITESYALFMDLPMCFRPKAMVKENKLAFSFDHTKKARFGILPRYAANELHIRCFPANAWEEEDEVVLITCRITNPDLEMLNGTIMEKVEHAQTELYEMRFNIRTGLALQKKLSESAVDFPRINEAYTGRKQRYVYATMFGEFAKITGIVKFDLHEEPLEGKQRIEVGGNVKGIFKLGEGRFGSEAVYVPREQKISLEEDDGYLIFFVHDELTGKSYVNVIDAKTMSADPVAMVDLPSRVPYGFHALFMTEEQLREQENIGPLIHVQGPSSDS